MKRSLAVPQLVAAIAVAALAISAISASAAPQLPVTGNCRDLAYVRPAYASNVNANIPCAAADKVVGAAVAVFAQGRVSENDRPWILSNCHAYTCPGSVSLSTPPYTWEFEFAQAAPGTILLVSAHELRGKGKVSFMLSSSDPTS